MKVAINLKKDTDDHAMNEIQHYTQFDLTRSHDLFQMKAYPSTNPLLL